MDTFWWWLLTVAAMLVALQVHFWLLHWEQRLMIWLRMPRCTVCNERCNHVMWAPDSEKPAPMCEFHFKEAMEMRVAEIRRRRAEAEDREGEEWKDA
jgi:hypothetical protein